MSRLDAKTKAFIERRFVAQEEERARRRKFHHRLFLIGFITGCCGFIIYGINRYGLHLPPILVFIGVACVLIWAACLSIYTGGHIIPTTFSKDADLRWHMNPWKDALDNLKEEANVMEALALLAVPSLLSLACLVVVEIFR
jgi:MFS superfamily sulfate permease-like transporter